MKTEVDLDVIIESDFWVDNVDFDAVKVALELKDLTFEYVLNHCKHELLQMDKKFSLNVCLSDNESVHRLNKEFRGLDKPTNVLSFASIDDEEFWDELETGETHALGDIILAFETLYEEANVKGISIYAHYCHLLVHGFLHLLGFDHQEDEEAEEMEELEVEILDEFSIANPYENEE
jgi:probable rRNA maturation factor